MHFAALVALAVVASTVPGLAAPTLTLHPSITGAKRDDPIIYHLPTEVVQDPASNTKRKRVPAYGSGQIWVTEGTSSNAKRQDTIANSDFDNWDNHTFDAKRQENIDSGAVIFTEDTSSNNAKREALTIGGLWSDYGVTEDTSSNNTKH